MYKKYKIRLKLAYSKDYIEKNYGKQMIFTMLKYCSILIFAIVATIFGSIIYNNYKSEKEITKTVDELKAIIGNPEDDDDIANYIISTPEEPEVNEETNTEDKPVTPTPSVEDEIRNKYVNNYDKLLEINSDMVGWLKVNNTKIDYPIVKGSNNSYYLNHNFYKNYEYNGWVFMDYRNNIEDMDTNTILFAHNRYYSGVMFGTLNNVTKESWYTNESNLYITFNTLYKKMKWKIFSIYGIDVTNDYLYTNFKQGLIFVIGTEDMSKKRFISQKREENVEIKLEYKNVPKVNTYEEIIKTCKNDSCAYVTLLNQDDIKNIIEEKSQIYSVNKKLKKDKKETIIFSDKNNEINLTKNLLYFLKEKKYNFDLFKKLSPEQNNILQFMPLHYTGINNYGYMNINYNTPPSSNKGEDEIHFITNFFNDKNSNYVLLFRKYILNLSCFKSNEAFNNDRDYNIYHVIIPKKSVNKINVNFSEENSFNS